MIIDNIQDFEKRVYDEYCKSDTELNGLFFDFSVSMTEAEILYAYGEIQAKINGDDVVRNKDGRRIRYDEAGFIGKGEYTNIYNGNAMKFLEGFNKSDIMNDIPAFERWNDDNKCEFVF